MLKNTPGDNFLRHALALEYVKAGNDLAAKEVFEQLLNEFPDYVGSYYHLAKLLERNGDNAGAIEWYNKGMLTAKKLNDRHAYNELQNACEDISE